MSAVGVLDAWPQAQSGAHEAAVDLSGHLRGAALMILLLGLGFRNAKAVLIAGAVWLAVAVGLYESLAPLMGADEKSHALRTGALGAALTLGGYVLATRRD